jgi:hypothetical protein
MNPETDALLAAATAVAQERPHVADGIATKNY